MISASVLPRARAIASGSAASAPRPLSACRHNQTNNLKAPSESSPIASVTSRPAANQPVTVFKRRRAEFIEDPPRLACGASCAWIHPSTRCGGHYESDGPECCRQWWDRRSAHASGPPATAKSGSNSGADSGHRKSPGSHAARRLSAGPWRSHPAAECRCGIAAPAGARCCHRHALPPVRGTVRRCVYAGQRSHPGTLSAPARNLTNSCRCRWGRSHSAYISEPVTIRYRWSHLFEVTLTVLRRIHREDGDCLVCESPSGHPIAVPVWMTDQAVCAGFSVGPPIVSLSALRVLRTFLDGLRSTAECDKPSENTSPAEASDEAKKQDKPETGRAVLRARVKQRSDPSPPGRKSRNGTQKGDRRAAPKRGARRRQSPKRR